MTSSSWLEGPDPLVLLNATRAAPSRVRKAGCAPVLLCYSCRCCTVPISVRIAPDHPQFQAISLRQRGFPKYITVSCDPHEMAARELAAAGVIPPVEGSCSPFAAGNALSDVEPHMCSRHSSLFEDTGVSDEHGWRKYHEIRTPAAE